MCARTVRRLVICPCPPILLPGATGRQRVPEVERLRAAAMAAVGWLLETGDPVLVLTIGKHGRVPGGSMLSAAAYGLRYRVRLGTAAGDGADLRPRTPGLLVAGYLLDGHPAEAIEVAGVERAVRHAAGLGPAAVLVCGGGSARRNDAAPGYVDPRAVPHDDLLVEQIAAPDLAGLAAADLDLAAELLCDLAAPLAVASTLAAEWAPPVQAAVDSSCAPFGVANIVARWWADA